MRSVRRVGCAVVLAAASLGSLGDELRIIIQSSPLAGFRYHAASVLWDRLMIGDRLDLVREPGNPHDNAAIRVEWQGHLLGYVPRSENAALAWALDRGGRVTARISRLQDHPNPRRRIEFEVIAR